MTAGWTLHSTSLLDPSMNKLCGGQQTPHSLRKHTIRVEGKHLV